MVILAAILGLAAAPGIPLEVGRATCSLSWRWNTDTPAGDEDNFMSVAGSKPTWNGRTIDEATLRDYLTRVYRAPSTAMPRPMLTLYGGGVACGELQRIAVLIETVVTCKPAFCAVSFAAPPAPKAGLSIPKGPSPLANPGTWVTRDDYPPAALRVGETGLSAFTLDLDDKGVPVRCVITQSSGSALLDQQTCALMTARARFAPLLDDHDKPMPSQWSNKFRWEIPVDRQLVLSWMRQLTFTIGPRGQILACDEQILGAAPDSKKRGCGVLSGKPPEIVKGMRGATKGPVTIVVRNGEIVAGQQPLPMPALSAAFKPVTSERTRIELDENGNPATCFADRGQGEAALSADDCHAMPRYLRGTGWHSISRVHQVLTNGDPDIEPALSAMAEDPQSP